MRVTSMRSGSTMRRAAKPDSRSVCCGCHIRTFPPQALHCIVRSCMHKRDTLCVGYTKQSSVETPAADIEWGGVGSAERFFPNRFPYLNWRFWRYLHTKADQAALQTGFGVVSRSKSFRVEGSFLPLAKKFDVTVTSAFAIIFADSSVLL